MSNLNHFFPEDFYPPVSRVYSLECSQGLQIASKLNILICGVVRDAGEILERNIKCIEHIRSYFNRSYVFIYENDSKDFSKNILEKYSKDGYSIVFKSETRGTKKLADKSLERRANMAYARNQYLEYAKTKAKYTKVDYVLVLDLDLYGYSYLGLLNSLSKIDDKSCIGSNSIIYQGNQRLYYDTWAYKDYSNLTEEQKNLMVFNRGEPLQRVHSCFGGMMLYPASILKHDIKYTEKNCDHITLHEQLVEKGYKIFLNPSQITLYSKHYYV